MISNSIRTGSFVCMCARASILSEEKCVCQIISVIHTSKKKKRIVSCPIMSISLTVFRFLNDGFSHLFTSTLFIRYKIQLITFVVWQGFLHLLENERVCEKKKKPISLFLPWKQSKSSKVSYFPCGIQNDTYLK
jgi:hypothetical protein